MDSGRTGQHREPDTPGASDGRVPPGPRTVQDVDHCRGYGVQRRVARMYYFSFPSKFLLEIRLNDFVFGCVLDVDCSRGKWGEVKV